MTGLPDWITTVPISAPPTHARRPNFARRTLGGLLRLLGALAAGELAAADGLLQRVDPRAKVLGLVGLLIAVTWVNALLPLGLACLGCLLLGLLSRLPVRQMAGAWLLAALLTALLMLPAAMSPISPGAPVLSLWRMANGHILAITAPGLLVLARFVLRTAAALALAGLLTATTPPHRLIHGLRALGVPRLFVMLLAMMVRYLAVLLRVAEEIQLGKLSRSPLPGIAARERRWAAAGIGALFRRTQALSDNVHLAMLSRGYTGEARLLDPPHWRAGDWVFLLCAAIGVAMLLISSWHIPH